MKNRCTSSKLIEVVNELIHICVQSTWVVLGGTNMKKKTQKKQQQKNKKKQQQQQKKKNKKNKKYKYFEVNVFN